MGYFILLAQVWVCWMGARYQWCRSVGSSVGRAESGQDSQKRPPKGMSFVVLVTFSHSTHLQKYPSFPLRVTADTLHFHSARKRKYLLFQTFPCTEWIRTQVFKLTTLSSFWNCWRFSIWTLGIFCAWYYGEYVDLSWLLVVVYKILLVHLQMAIEIHGNVK